MTTSIVHTAEQETAIRYFKKKYNAANGTSLTNGAFADLQVLDIFNGLVSQMNADRSGMEILQAFQTATPTQQTAARTALGIQEP